MIREAVSRLASTVSPSSSTLKRLSSPSTIVISVQAQTGLHRTQGSDNRVTCIQINQQIPMFFPSLFFPLYFRDPYIVSSNPKFRILGHGLSRAPGGKQEGPEPTAADGLPGRSRKSYMDATCSIYNKSVRDRYPLEAYPSGLLRIDDTRVRWNSFLPPRLPSLTFQLR